ncbi:MAG: NapC/NirT family cytochrome c [Sedimenticola sp.]|uniref:Cytochrome C552 n=1 Tax=Sedimenticola thiotaurini TaxID=1543721 RepID=A0A558CMC8_9GAMM|nr:NapC/NirT family cytochrome c [Sedimenticola sp.]MCW8975984.1 NapC/NirT family cytochrome c [Sedimenticola sp.]TVT49910.1 MAG: cytochrome C552 [Sedimenticola thiotaurini]
MADQESKKTGFMSRRIILGTTIAGALLFFIGGIIFWGGFNTAMEATNKLEFCISCHEMEENVYQEYKPTIHYSNRTGVRATCPDCHVPDPWIHKMVRKIQASNEVFHKIMGTVDTPEKFDANRLTMAKRVWNTMKSTDSRECRNCHNFESMNPEFQRPRARKQHMNAFETGQTCIDCHKGIAHKHVRDLLSDEELEKLEAPDPRFIRPVPEMFKEGLKRVEAKEAAEAEAEKVAKEKEREAKIAAKQAEQARIDAAVAAALAGKGAAATGKAGAAPAAAGMGIDWSDVPSRKITLFYPGETSMEWVMTGKDHGGARPFLKGGDRCITCHDKETADMGQKMVSGAKAETTPIPGKRGSIPVNVQAAHNGENLYLRFEWEDGEHTPAPFVDGGKMDPANPMKLAIMLGTDDVEFADRAGCWQTCHHDARTMPDTPAADVAAASEAAKSLDLKTGVTKYLQESRSKIEIKGKRGKKRGGWDQLKSGDEIAAALKANQFMDLLRYKSGKGETEDGYILDQRYMQGGQGFEVNARKEGGNWIVEMKRKLKSDKPGDITIEAGKLYNFGFAIHDDYTNARFHHVSLGYKLGLDSETAEVNAVKREAKAVAQTAAKAAPVAAAAGKAGSAIKADWSKAGSREITLFYPGETSIEWVMTGKDHGGARPFLNGGDRCVTCHDKETADMGSKMVSGAKAETSPIPGKRGSIPVTVESTHDSENLYLRFTWPMTDHVAIPFVEGGKMDPENPVKLALMLSTDDVEFADRAGCWQTCHHDANTMPDTPDPATASGSEAAKMLDLKSGVTKYLKESRSKIEIKGKRGKKRGGWDQLKSGDEIAAALKANQFMDLLRVKAGTGATEDGYILDQRYMKGGQGFEATTAQEAGNWVVTLKRKLKSDAAGDISLDTGKVYNFGFAIHDDFSSARFHHVSLGYKLGFDADGVEINAIKQ